MGQGRAPYNVLKRSVLRPLSAGLKAGMGDGIGQQAARETADPRRITASSCRIFGKWPEAALRFTFWRTEQEILASGGQWTGIRPSFLFPHQTEEGLAAVWMRELNAFCQDRNIPVLGVSVLGSAAVTAPICQLTGYGTTAIQPVHPAPGWDIVAVGHAAMEGTALLAGWARDELERRFTQSFLSGALEMESGISAEPMLTGFDKWDQVLIHPLGEGGILAGLWNLAERTGLGLTVRLRDIPIRQETVEICEYFGLNPYQLASGGMALLASQKGEELAREFRQRGFCSQVMGKLTDQRERAVENGEDKRFLDRPAPDEIYKTGLEV